MGPFLTGDDIPSEEQKLEDHGYCWFTFIGCGAHPMPARGPFKTTMEANLALDRFNQKYEDKAGTYLHAGSVRLVATKTRDAARKADISGEGSRYKIIASY